MCVVVWVRARALAHLGFFFFFSLFVVISNMLKRANVVDMGSYSDSDRQSNSSGKPFRHVLRESPSSSYSCLLGVVVSVVNRGIHT